MMVFSTLRPEQIDLSRIRSEGVAGLKAFLEFASKGKGALPVKLSKVSSDKDIAEEIIADKIRALNYEVHTNIGCSEYKIDIGIVHPYKKGEYILGIMCDGENYQAAHTARDRNILQGSVLKSLGWNVYRLWILDWWENQTKELGKIRAAVEEALKKEESGRGTETIKAPSKQIYAYKKMDAQIENAVIDETIKYTLCTLDSIMGGAEEFCLLQNNLLIISQIKQVLEVEAP